MHSIRNLLFVFFMSSLLCSQELVTRYWEVTLQNESGESIKDATIRLIGKRGQVVSNTSPSGSFRFLNPAPDDYQLDVVINGVIHHSTAPINLKTDSLPAIATLSVDGVVTVTFRSEEAAAKTGGE